MIDNNKINLLNDEYIYYLERAKTLQAEGNLIGASKFYVLAAKSMLEIAELCPETLKKAKVAHAKQLIEMAETLKDNAPVVKKRKKQGNKGTEENDEDGKKWQSCAIPDVSFDDIAGLADVKRVITLKMINPIKYPEKYKTYDIKTGGGVLLYGPPGTGKTLIAKAIAHEVGASFYVVKASDIISKWVGESEQNIKTLFETASQDERAIIFIDELDGLFGERGQDVHSDRRVNEFLQQMDGFVSKSENLLLLGATNLPWLVDAAAKRPGRFSQEIYVPLPDFEARKFLVKKSLKKFSAKKTVDEDTIARALEGYSGADIVEVCDRAKSRCLDRDLMTDKEQVLTMDDFYAVIFTSRPSVSRRDILRYEQYAHIDTFLVEELMGSERNKNVVNSQSNQNEDLSQDNTTQDKQEKETIKEEKTDESKKKENKVEVEFEKDKVSLMPNEGVVLAFCVSEKAEWIDLIIDGKTYACKNRLKLWESEPIEISPGKYDVVLRSEKFSFTTQIEFVRGFTENDLF